MSDTRYDLDYKLWDYYLQECRAAQSTPTLSDFDVWKQDQDYDLDEDEWEAVDVE